MGGHDAELLALIHDDADFGDTNAVVDPQALIGATTIEPAAASSTASASASTANWASIHG